VRWFRTRTIVCAGLAIVVVGVGMLTQVGASSLPIVVVACVVMMVGFGMVVTLTSDLIIAAAPEERAGAASAISETGSELGGALGIAVLGSIGTAVYRREVADAIPSAIPPEAAATARDTLGGAVGVAGQLPDQLGLALLDASRAAFVDGFQLVAICGVAIMIGLVGLAALWLREGQVDAASAEPLGPRPDHLIAECACAR
jgi:MFS transporter, DHA2 family, multidrug resistance protein